MFLLLLALDDLYLLDRRGVLREENLVLGLHVVHARLINMYIYIYICTHTYTYVYIYIYREREIDR